VNPLAPFFMSWENTLMNNNKYFWLDTKFYLSGCIVIGLLQIVDGGLALNHVKHEWLTAFSILENVWFLVTLVFYFIFKNQNLSLVIPSSFLLYMVIGVIYGIFLVSTSHDAFFELPVWYKVYATLFGCYFFLFSTWCYVYWFLKNNR